ncbi:LacI family DNA-binding transcriptional regulator [Lichenihabitans sp. Uapishka_5]|uniref:LacI family DNA-binding transcriptional regulator n=1 Tax=Lichenihabitans sp. Uapishka_5 TaxID=3037302 RepID=UPI0029E7D59B|nr:LacI family DNA-binding transcriptional regulator [Lichenihabitans sp. Uapishka_5]MDX7953022.1 LacI family DNA-binding transcriptional regulator [Lichenihabitans sp. Uapishka_5]
MTHVAQRAGVSAMTVSRALRKDGAISAATRQRIMAAVEELGYVLDQTAGTFSSKRSGFVAALVPSLNNSNFADTARGVTDALDGSGLQMLLGYTDYSTAKEEEIVQSMLMRRPEGLILTGGRHTERARRLLTRAGVPVVETWDMPGEPVGHVVGFSNAEATRSLVHHLHERGYRRIGYIGGTSNRDTRGADRRVGFLRAAAELGLDRERIVSFGQPPISMSQGGEAIVQLLSRWPDTDAAVCVSDLSAFGALSECRRRGWAVPGRVALAGFGDFEIASAAVPSLTTVAVDSYGIGHRAGDVLLQAILARRDDRAMPAETVLMPFRIIERETT